jgi:hypothetical protein
MAEAEKILRARYGEPEGSLRYPEVVMEYIDTARYRRYNLRNKEAPEDLKNCPKL